MRRRLWKSSSYMSPSTSTKSWTRRKRADLEAAVRGLDGAVSVHLPAETPHLVLVGYNPEKTRSKAILDAVLAQGVHAELVGL